jgi:hypothetical protein
LQSVSSADAGAEFEFGGHAWHVGLPLADHVPRTHGRQVSASVARATSEYSPPPHAEHCKRSLSS